MGVRVMELRDTGRVALAGRWALLWVGASVMGWGITLRAQSDAMNPVVATGSQSSSEPESCRVQRVARFPGSHKFASDFIEAIAGDPDPDAKDPDVIWGLTADLSNDVPAQSRALYISKSIDGGATWSEVARVDSRYFDAKIGEGLRNGFSVAPGGSYFVVTTQRGAFQVFPESGAGESVVKVIEGPRVPDSPPKIPITKKAGDPVRANVVEISADGKRMLVGYGYFDLTPQLFSYRKANDGSWVQEGAMPLPPTEMDLLSMEYDDPKKVHPGFLYLGTGDQVYLLNLHSMRWSRVDGVGPDSAIHGMSVVGGLHLAACWGVYEPTGPGTVRRVTEARFLIHRSSDEAGSNVRAYTVEVDAAKPNREVVTSLTGVYTSDDSGENWRRINDLPNEEFRTAHFSADGTLLVSGIAGTYIVNPFSEACSPRLKVHER